MLWLAGCAESERFSYATEADEPNYREGIALLKTGRKQEALAAFMKVISKRGDDSAESHLEVGLLYLQHINDPLSAIYHFKKFLSLRPNSPQASLVRQRIDAATRDFARTLPAQPLENQLQRVDLVATLDRLKHENESMKEELANLKAGRGVSVTSQPLAQETVPVAVANEPEAVASVSLESSPEFSFNVPTVRTRRQANLPEVRVPPSAPQTPPPAPKSAASAQPQPQPKTATPAAAPVAGGKRHIVRPGENLSQISMQYYKTRSKWRDIYAANRGVMKSETDLKVGMALRIP